VTARNQTTRRAGVLSAALLASLLLFSQPAAGQETEQIHNYDVQIAVESTGHIFVTEVIDYDFGANERHGIFREIPVRFHYDDRYDRVYPIEVLSVKGSLNTPDQFEEEREGNLLRIRIGDPDRTIKGRHSYAIVYRVEGALNGFPDHNELYWNAIGDEWDVPIDNASVTVTTIGITEVACFTGPDFSTLPCTSSKAVDPTATFTQNGLAPFENFTVVVGFRTGLIPTPAPILKERWNFARAFSLTAVTGGLAGGLLVLVLIAVGRLLWIKGRDRRAAGSQVDIAFGTTQGGEQAVPLLEEGTYPVEFAVPDGIRPGQVGVLVDETANPVDVTATIVDLGVRGYLRIEEIPKKWLLGKPDWRLVQLKQGDGELLKYERVLLEGLFQDPDEDGSEDLEEEELEDESAAELTAAELNRDEALYGGGNTSAGENPPDGGLASVTVSTLRRKFHVRFLRVQKALYADVARHRWFTAPPDRVRAAWAGRGIAATLAGAGLTALAAWRTHLGLIPLPLVVGGLTLWAGAKRMPRRTAKGTGLVRRVLGFRTYMDAAETHMARWAEQENVFSRYLPYAIVFGLTEKWARAFAHLGEPPATPWYVGTRPFSTNGFVSSVDNFALSSAGTLASRPAASGSSGFGRGGSSGGGGGGGGGGSW
jgi:uncharacterized membrane protein YgcG